MSHPSPSSAKDARYWKPAAHGSIRNCSPIQAKDVALLSEYITGRLYLATLNTSYQPQCTKIDHFFSTDDDFVYQPFNHDFGPLCLSSLIRYCLMVKAKLYRSELRDARIIHYTSLDNPPQRANATFLISAFAVLCLNRSPIDALLRYNPHRANVPPLMPFRDATTSERSKHIYMSDCLNALFIARQKGLFDPDDFDVHEFERLQGKGHGDLSWVVPRRLLAFTGPRDEGPGCRPRAYVDYFRASGVWAVVRLNRPEYDSGAFLRAGIRHRDLFFPDGTPPPRRVARAFLRLCEDAEGPVAVHCKAGLGRTGALIAARLVGHYGMRAKEAVAWVRICRPGSIMSSQQEWLERNERYLVMTDHSLSRCWRDNRLAPADGSRKDFPFGIHSIREKVLSGQACEMRERPRRNEQSPRRSGAGTQGGKLKRSSSASFSGGNGKGEARRAKVADGDAGAQLGKKSHC